MEITERQELLDDIMDELEKLDRLNPCIDWADGDSFRREPSMETVSGGDFVEYQYVVEIVNEILKKKLEQQR